MLQALIVTLREGVEAALVIGIAVAYLHKAGRSEMLRWVYLALGAAVAASLALGYAFARLEWNQDRFEGWVMLVAGALVGTLVVAMWRAGRRMKAQIEQGLARAFASPAAAPALFLFVFLMVLREGAETVLMLAAVRMNSSDLWSIAGTVLGLGLAVVFAILFVRGSVRVNLSKFFGMTTIILLFVVVQLMISGIHELSEQGVVPATRSTMALIGPIVRNQVFFFVTILALAALMVLLDWRRRAATPPEKEPAAAANRAERRLATWTARRERLWMTLVSSAAFVFILLVTAEFIYATNHTGLSPARRVTAQDGMVRIPLTELAGGDLHRYVYSSAAGTTRFFLIARPGQEPGVAVDACQICGALGYYRRQGNVICRNCSAEIYVPSIGMPGGCNPIPLKHSVTEGEVRIPAASLAEMAPLFAPR